ncbi:uncharacterized protein LOC129237950 [Anastrepha obliqua]|uniref:uncharacterized protein LOC129237950 n=1 Tax=Anastrepha obliqua TaxID=95512 RepID=UPI00240927B2|nr:uncharacterized protein LOC129237950 [Anastrepha obliqua]
MTQVPIDKLLMTLSVLLTSPENYIQLNSQYVNVARFGANNNAAGVCKLQEMRNLSSVIDAAMGNQLKIDERVNNILVDLQTIVNRLSNTEVIDCERYRASEIIIKLPNLETAFTMLNVSSMFGENWLLIAHRQANGQLFLNTKTELLENGIGELRSEYFIGFEKLRAITESHLCELLFIESRNSCDIWLFDYYKAVAFSADNKVKMLGDYRTNRLEANKNLTAHLQAVNERLALKSDSHVRIFLRIRTLDTEPDLF